MRAFGVGFFPHNLPLPVFSSALLGVGGGKGVEELHPWPFADVPQRVATAWPRHRDVTATAAGGRHAAHRQRGNGGWGTREMVTAIIARGGEGATKKKGIALSSGKRSFTNDD